MRNSVAIGCVMAGWALAVAAAAAENKVLTAVSSTPLASERARAVLKVKVMQAP